MRIIWCLLYFMGSVASIGQTAEEKFLRENVRPIDFSAPGEGKSMQMINLAAKDYRFFFVGEEHWQAMNTRIQYGFLINLHKNGNVRNLIVEAGYSYGHMINRYLETGNEQLLIKAIYDTPVCPDDLMEFYRNLYQYNQKQGPKAKIKVYGIDVEQSPLLAIECLAHLLPGKILTAGVRDRITQLKELAAQKNYDEKEARKFFRQFYKELQERKWAYRRYWGDKFWLFEMIMENTIQGFDFPLLREFVYAHSDDRRREERMYRNFKLLHRWKMFQTGNYFAQFGAIHTELNPSINWGYKTLAHQLNYDRYSPVKEKVLTVSKYFRRITQIYEKFKDYDELIEMMDLIEKSVEGDVILCRIMGNEDRFPEISQDFHFILLLKEELELEKCK
ncbi:MAG: hypothetical protein KDE26_17725 [Bacteroidetes bacterium]|nr:hypothetical protein [Bacteroidota bacterium]